MAANMRRASMHWLRHTSASHALNKGANLRSVKTILGHASLQTTSIYTNIEDAQLVEDMEKHGTEE